MSATRPALALLATMAITGCGLLSGPAAPEACGFPDGTVLEFAGRATTSALGLVEVADDPILSIEPADIYITRDQLTQGDHQGRLVCAIYVTQSGFTEITVHPDDLPPPVAPEAPAPRTRAESTDQPLRAPWPRLPIISSLPGPPTARGGLHRPRRLPHCTRKEHR
jgi:hypothetical protein